MVRTWHDWSRINSGHIKSDDNEIDILYWDSNGRIRFDQSATEPTFTIGYRLFTMDLDTNHPSLPSGLTDLAVAGGLRLGEIADGWELGLVAGAGVATNNHFGDGDAYYGLGTVNIKHDLDESATLNFGINYDGNRTIFPDVPLPYIMYSCYVDENLSYNIGAPLSSVTYKPIDPLTLEARYFVPTQFTGQVSWAIVDDSISLFALYDRRVAAFHLEDDRDTRRLFYRINRVKMGLRYSSADKFNIEGGVGYAFEQSFYTGFDVRNTDTVAKPSDELFFFIGFQGYF